MSHGYINVYISGHKVFLLINIDHILQTTLNQIYCRTVSIYVEQERKLEPTDIRYVRLSLQQIKYIWDGPQSLLNPHPSFNLSS